MLSFPQPRILWRDSGESSIVKALGLPEPETPGRREVGMVPSDFAGIHVQNTEGQAEDLAAILSAGPTLLLFIRHFG